MISVTINLTSPAELAQLAAALGSVGKSSPANITDIARTCAVHETPMKPSQHRAGAFYCPKKNPDGTYCKSEAA